MPVPSVSSYAIQLVNANRDFSAIRASSIDLLITDGNPNPRTGAATNSALSDENLRILQAEGRIVAGYVNVAVTDHLRYYWQSQWTTTGDDTGALRSDTNVPAWLRSGRPIDFTGDNMNDAYLVDYSDAQWRQIVIDQAQELVRRGYKAIFLDDVGSYFRAGNDPATRAPWADRMIDLVVAVRAALPSDIVIIANTDPFIVTATTNWATSPRGQAYRDAVDFHLIENQTVATYDAALINLPNEPLLVLQRAPNLLTDAIGWSRGVLYNSPSANYDRFAGETPYPATPNSDTLNGGIGPNQINGLAGDDILSGLGGSDKLFGGVGNDRLDGGSGSDLLYGGQGNDAYLVDSAGDLVFENANEGTDSVSASVSHYLYSNVEVLTLIGTGNIFGVGNDLANTLTGNSGENLLIAGAGADIVRGGAARDAIFGESGDDQLFGDAGVDYIVGGIGNDSIDGGVDADEIYGQDGDDVLNGGTGFHTDIIVGGAGNDTIRGDSGLGDFDFLYGNAGNDIFHVDTPADLVFESIGEGTDTVFASINGAGFYLYDNIENLTLLGNTPFGVGNALANTITGNTQGNYLLGGAGNDILNGMGGGDVLFGQAGADTFVFGRGTGGDVIGDYVRGTDKIDLRAFGFTSFAQLQGTFAQNGGDGAIILGNGDLVVLQGVVMNQLVASDFFL